LKSRSIIRSYQLVYIHRLGAKKTLLYNEGRCKTIFGIHGCKLEREDEGIRGSSLEARGSFSCLLSQAIGATTCACKRTDVDGLAKGENGQKNPLTIFTCISFYSVGNRIRKVRNGIWSAKSGLSKTDKSEQKCLSIDQQTVISIRNMPI
jgi:hypothetical protein